MKESLAYTHQLLCLDEEITSSLESVSQDITLTPGGKQLQVAAAIIITAVPTYTLDIYLLTCSVQYRRSDWKSA